MYLTWSEFSVAMVFSSSLLKGYVPANKKITRTSKNTDK